MNSRPVARARAFSTRRRLERPRSYTRQNGKHEGKCFTRSLNPLRYTAKWYMVHLVLHCKQTKFPRPQLSHQLGARAPTSTTEPHAHGTARDRHRSQFSSAAALLAVLKTTTTTAVVKHVRYQALNGANGDGYQQRRVRYARRRKPS